jgi:4-hydroxybenzoyl-CoA thioesterase
MFTNRRDLYVEWGDCDPGGIIYFPRYLEYCDMCTNQLFEKVGLHKPDMLKKFDAGGIPMIDIHARFFVPSQFGETITIETGVSEWGKSSFTVHHKVWKGDVLSAEIFEKRVWVVRLPGEPIRYKGAPIPQEVKDRLSGKYSAAND